MLPLVIILFMINHWHRNVGYGFILVHVCWHLHPLRVNVAYVKWIDYFVIFSCLYDLRHQLLNIIVGTFFQIESFYEYLQYVFIKLESGLIKTFIPSVDKYNLQQSSSTGEHTYFSCVGRAQHKEKLFHWENDKSIF